MLHLELQRGQEKFNSTLEKLSMNMEIVSTALKNLNKTLEDNFAVQKELADHTLMQCKKFCI